jgi:hypothetical protein
MGPPTSVRMHFSNRCRASGVRSIHPPIRLPQRHLAENMRFRGPLIRLRQRNRRLQMLSLLILQSPLAMTSTRLSKTRTWLETGLCYTDHLNFSRFIRYTKSCNSPVLYQLVSRRAFRKWSDIFCCLHIVFEKNNSCTDSTYDGCTVNDVHNITWVQLPS